MFFSEKRNRSREWRAMRVRADSVTAPANCARRQRTTPGWRTEAALFHPESITFLKSGGERGEKKIRFRPSLAMCW
jgi:hypothetical protein